MSFSTHSGRSRSDIPQPSNVPQSGGSPRYSKSLIGWAVGVVVAFVLLIVMALGSFYTIDQGERGVVLRNGKIIGLAEPGLGFKVPFLDSVKEVSVRDHTYQQRLEAYSYDQQPATMIISLTYRVSPDQVLSLYSEYGSLENLQTRVLERRSFDITKNVFGTYTAANAIQKRAQMGIDVNAAVRAGTGDSPVTVVAVQIEEVGFSTAYEQSIEQRMLAEVEIQKTTKQKETAEINAQIRVVNATADAEAKRQQFTAEADGIKLRGNAEAQAIEARARALAANTNLVQLNAVDKWDGRLPTTQLPGSTLPFIGVK